MSEGKIDQNLYSRQLFVLGQDAMKSLVESDVLLIGVGGCGVEIAKNLILAGVRSLTIWDNKQVTMADVTSHYYLNESHIGQSRGLITRPRLAELNGYVQVKQCNEEFQLEKEGFLGSAEADEFLKEFCLVILTEYSHTFSLTELLGQCCHDLAVKFIVADTRGVCGQIFCDFGEQFLVKDTTGDESLTIPISHIDQNSDSTRVHLMERHFYRLFDGDTVTFRGVKGMTELNNEQRKIKIVGDKTFEIGDTTGYSQYEGAGVLVEVKPQILLDFESFGRSWQNPQIKEINDDDGQKLHILFKALSTFHEEHQRLPKSWDEDDAELLDNIVSRTPSGDVSLIEKSMIHKFAYTCRGSLPPFQAVVGGIAAQEAVKACSGKFTPLQQWMYLDAFSCLPTEKVVDYEIRQCHPRYEAQVAVLGESVLKRLHEMTWFMVGAGAIGCEMLKNFAMMGVACEHVNGQSGQLIVTDMDQIERSNLNRQFLFRNHDIGSFKSKVAAAAVKAMNPQINIIAQTNKVGPEMEHFYNSEFYKKLDGIANALDNVEARKYTDACSHLYGLPLLESGTQGTRGHTQIILPHLTAGYEAPSTNPDGKIAICTLKNFPYLITHTIQWARDLFEGLFVQPSKLAVRFLKDRDELIAHLETLPHQEALDSLKKLQLVLGSPASTVQDCVDWARNLWEEHYHNNIEQLLYNYPPDHFIDGLPFWSEDKKKPHSQQFSLDDENHLDFILAAANLRAQIFNVPARLNSREVAKTMLRQVVVPVFQLNQTLKIAANDEELKKINESQLDSIAGQVKSAIQLLKSSAVPVDLHINVIEFEKDDDTNHHIDFITAASNLRAINYEIEPVDRLKTLGIAGRIIPAIATTTGVITGLICLEVYKLTMDRSLWQTEMFQETSVELANVNVMFLFSSPPRKLPNTTYTEWSIFNDAELKNLTLQELLDFFMEKYNLDIFSVTYRNLVLFPRLSSDEEDAKCLALKMEDLVEHVQKKPLESFQRNLIFDIYSSDDNIEVLPRVIYEFTKPSA